MQACGFSGVDHELSSALICAPNSFLLSVTSAHHHFLVRNALFATMWPDFSHSLGHWLNTLLLKAWAHGSPALNFYFNFLNTHYIFLIRAMPPAVCVTWVSWLQFVMQWADLSVSAHRVGLNLHGLDCGPFEGSGWLTFIAAGGNLTFCWIWSFLLPSLRELLSCLLHPVRKC